MPITISGGTSNKPSPTFIMSPCPDRRFLKYTHPMSTVGMRTNIKLYRCSIGRLSPLPRSHAPVTSGGRTDFVPCQSRNGPLFRWVGGSSPNRMEFLVKDMDGGVKSSSSELLFSTTIGVSFSPSETCKASVGRWLPSTTL